MSTKKLDEFFTEDLLGVRCGVGSPGSFARAKSIVQERKHLARIALHWARRGDWRYLASHIELGEIINEDIRAFLVQVLRQEVARPNNRAQTQLKISESFVRAMRVCEEIERGAGREAAINKVADQFEIDRATVRRALRAHESQVRRMWSLDVPEATSVRYEIDRGALSQHFMS
jgi:hypothetical protein